VEEVELKFDIERRDIGRLLRSPALRDAQAATASLVSIYFDTPDEALAARAMTLRLRRAGERWEQTLKGGGSVQGGLHARGEWQFESDGSLDLAAFRDTPLAQMPRAGALHERLAEIFRVEVERTTWELEPARGVRMEVALDDGVVRHRSRTDAVLEVEIESKAGPAEALFDLAARLMEHVTLQPSAVTKAARGYRLVHGWTPVPVHARAVDLAGVETTWEAACAVLAAGLEQLQANAGGVRISDDPEFVHQLRVALRRVRSSIRVFRPALGRALEADVRAALKAVTRIAGRARDLDVLALETLPALRAAGAPATTGSFDARLASARAEAREGLRKELRSRRHALALLALTQALHRRAEDAAGGRKARAFAARRLRKAHRALMHATARLDDLGAPGRHALRIRAKRLRYALEATGSLFEAKAVRRYTQALSRMQDCLGEVNDAVVAARLLRELGAPPRLATFARGWLEARAEAAFARTSEGLDALRSHRAPWEED